MRRCPIPFRQVRTRSRAGRTHLGVCERHLPAKRLFDVGFSLTVLALGFPIYGLLTLLTYLSFGCRTSPFYSHVRIGRGGRPFRCYKFRTMVPDAEQRLAELLREDPKLREEWKRSYKLKVDPRITSMGSFLRRTSLDELPQFWNVLRGDLSVVGPRPLVRAEVTHYLKGRASKILSIRPGLTGLWQISGRSDVSYEERLSLDERYVQNRTLFGDVLVVIKTIPAMFTSSGAY